LKWWHKIRVTWYIGAEMNYSIRYQNIVTNLLISEGMLHLAWAIWWWNIHRMKFQEFQKEGSYLSPTAIMVNSNPFLTDFRWTWFGKLAKPTKPPIISSPPPLKYFFRKFSMAFQRHHTLLKLLAIIYTPFFLPKMFKNHYFLVKIALKNSW